MYISCLCSLINSSWPVSLVFPGAAVFVSALISPLFSLFFPVFFPESCSRSMLNEGMATLGCAVTNWHRGGRWRWGGDWLSCHLLQWHELISMSLQQPHMLGLCNPHFGYPHMQKAPPPGRTLTRTPPYTSFRSPLVSMMGAAKALADCQRRSARLRSEGRRDAEGFDREPELRLMVGCWDTQPTTKRHTITDLLYMSEACTCKQAVLFTERLS